MHNTDTAHREWASRPAEERFFGISEALAHAARRRAIYIGEWR